MKKTSIGLLLTLSVCSVNLTVKADNPTGPWHNFHDLCKTEGSYRPYTCGIYSYSVVCDPRLSPIGVRIKDVCANFCSSEGTRNGPQDAKPMNWQCKNGSLECVCGIKNSNGTFTAIETIPAPLAKK